MHTNKQLQAHALHPPEGVSPKIAAECRVAGQLQSQGAVGHRTLQEKAARVGDEDRDSSMGFVGCVREDSCKPP